MAEIEKWCRGQGSQMVQVEVFAPNEHARSFYEQLGYLPRYIDHLKQL
jgi:GNAT superfamily N-acetyltransferase